MIVLRGSQQTGVQVDLWSDTDILMILHPKIEINEDRFIHAHNPIGNILGSEIYRGLESILYRTAIEYESSIHLLDSSLCTYNEWTSIEALKDQSFTVVYGHIEIPTKAVMGIAKSDLSFSPYENEINKTWFKFTMAIKKFARKDNLIGMHLLLDLIREYLTLEMIERDIREKTNIHRLGHSEHLPASIKLSNIEETNQEGLLNYIANLAHAYDQKLLDNVSNYKSRRNKISEYIDESIRYLRGEH
ncbi:hypothetical protein [Ferroacidibacillus organovorans]|uniref:Nucleotidyltransferase n=1 Tax=Ferroacidibacillus organovorans TaxID=1765683 RepID=A0A101XSC6_9BACL|nr:hypothetical protein [Ferroacidibacillus organovorans]KUO96626.1 hypothetical protein ATW55_00685 [Ferroacidibacillus organovorans]